jgi:hypothetical protein
VVAALQGTGEIAGQPDIARRESILRREMRIHRHNVEMTGNRPLIEIRMDAAAEVGRDELVG